MNIKKLLLLYLSTNLISQVIPPFIGERFRSFRYLSTVGLIEDDLDLLLDPGRYFEIEKNILYSGLSNFATNNDLLFSGISGAYFMFGFKNTFKPLGNVVPTSLLYAHRTLRMPQPNLINGRGEGELFISEKYDTDGNGSFDSLHVEKAKSYSYLENKENPFFIGFSREIGEIIAGIFFFHLKLSNINEPAGHPIFNRFGNLYYLREEKDLITLTLLEKEEWNGKGFVDTSTQQNIFGTSIYLKELFLNSDLGIQAGYGINNLKISEDIFTTAYIDYNPGGVTSREDRNYARFQDLNSSGSSYFLRLFTRRTRNQELSSEDNLYFTFYGSGISKTTSPFHRVEYIHLREDIGTGTLRETRNMDKVEGNVAYESKINGLILGYRFKGFIDDEKRIFFAIGFFFNNNTSNSTSKVDSNFQVINYFNDGDNQPSDPDDYTVTTTFTRVDELKSSYSRMSFELPVACELKFNKSLLFRMGANPYFSFTENEQTLNPLFSSSIVTKTTRGDGTETVTTRPAQRSFGLRNLSKGKSSGVDFSYGLSYKIGKNLSIDLMGFSNLTDLSNWRVSVVFKF
ncbi:MAG: hypothetical protein ABDH49_04865 [Candidatus Hydrothermales bacterium]